MCGPGTSVWGSLRGPLLSPSLCTSSRHPVPVFVQVAGDALGALQRVAQGDIVLLICFSDAWASGRDCPDLSISQSYLSALSAWRT